MIFEEITSNLYTLVGKRRDILLTGLKLVFQFCGFSMEHLKVNYFFTARKCLRYCVGDWILRKVHIKLASQVQKRLNSHRLRFTILPFLGIDETFYNNIIVFENVGTLKDMMPPAVQFKIYIIFFFSIMPKNSYHNFIKA